MTNPFRTTASVLLVCTAPCALALAQATPSPFEQAGEPAPRNEVDEIVFGRLEQLGIRPAHPCSDAVFVRRVHLDAIGTLPTAREVRAFLEDEDPGKRDALIDRVLQRDEFADYWAMRWSDVLRVRSEFPINLWPNAAQAYHRWIRSCLWDDVPLDRFARELLTASGSNFRVPQVNFYRALQSKDPESIARAVALTFMGTRSERWPAERQAGLAGFFAQVGYKSTAEWKEEIVFFDPERPTRAAVFPDGTPAEIESGVDPRAVFAEWLLDPGNPRFPRSVVNRVWAWLLGRGIVHEPDDLRPDNPPSHPELLDRLAARFVAGGYDLKDLIREILSSETYQLSCIPRSDHPEAEALFAHYALRRLDAEVLIDALNQVTGTTDRYTSEIPEPFTFVPPDQRTISLPDASITSAFLELFGRPPRDTGLWAERNDRISTAQRLHLLNSSHVQRKIAQGPRLRALLRSSDGPRGAISNLYLAILSRFPTDAERKALAERARAGRAAQSELAVDVAWALINSTEFLYRH